jgi:hypothetical protein
MLNTTLAHRRRWAYLKQEAPVRTGVFYFGMRPYNGHPTITVSETRMLSTIVAHFNVDILFVLEIEAGLQKSRDVYSSLRFKVAFVFDEL